MTTYFWKGEESSDVDDPDNWYNPLTTSVGTRPTNGDSVVFDSTSDSFNDCQFTSATFPTSGDIVDITISANFTKFLTTNTNTTLNIDGKLDVNVAGKIKITHTMTFNFKTAGTTTVYDGNGDSYAHKPLVIYNVADSLFHDENSRVLATFNFNALNLSMIDGIYPNITFTGTIYAKSIYSNNSRSLHNTYGSVDILDFNGGSINSTLYNIYDYDKQFLFEKGFTSIGEFFNFGHTTARFKTYRSSGTGSVIFPSTGELNSAAFGNDTTNNFYTQYNKIIIENNDNSSNYWLLRKTIECNELIINDGGRFYGPSEGTKAAGIRCVKRPTIRGDWNFRQITDGIYESIGDSSNVSVYHGGTGRQTITKNALLYGNGNDKINLLGIGAAGKYLKVNSGANGYEWADASGGGGSSANDSTITLTAGTGLSTGGDFTTNQSSDETITFNVSGLTVSELAADSLQTSGETFANNDTSLMTSAAIEDKIATQVSAALAAQNYDLSPIAFEARSLGTSTGVKIPAVASGSSSVAIGYPMPLAGKVKYVSFVFTGGAITGNAINVFRVVKNHTTSASNYVDVDFNAEVIINKGASGEYIYTHVSSLGASSLAFSAGDVIWVQRFSGSTDLQHAYVVLWVGI